MSPFFENVWIINKCTNAWIPLFRCLSEESRNCQKCWIWSKRGSTFYKLVWNSKNFWITLLVGYQIATAMTNNITVRFEIFPFTKNKLRSGLIRNDKEIVLAIKILFIALNLADITLHGVPLLLTQIKSQVFKSFQKFRHFCVNNCEILKNDIIFHFTQQFKNYVLV